MIHDHDLVEELPYEEAHSKFLPMMLLETSRIAAAELRFGAGGGRSSRDKTEVKQK